VTELWTRSPDRIDVDCLYAGEVGCVAAGIRSVKDARVGDTITLRKVGNDLEMLPGYNEAKPQARAPCGHQHAPPPIPPHFRQTPHQRPQRLAVPLRGPHSSRFAGVLRPVSR